MPYGPREQSKPMDFPIFGVDLSTAAFDQRPQTTALGINVRGFDAGTDRKRGGSRAGLTPFFGAGSVAQVNGFNFIQSLACIVTAAIDATFQGTLFATPQFTINYSEVNSPPSRDAPQIVQARSWFTGTNPTFVETSGVVVGTPDGGGTGKGTSQYQLSTDGTTITIVGTFLSAGFAGPYFYAGAPQVVTKTILNSLWLPPATGVVTFTWAVVSGSFIAQHTVDIRAI